jgi:hypothetical protein
MIRTARTKDYNWNFDTTTGMFARWGDTFHDDPEWSPLGPEILDIEVTTKCKGPGGKLCKFCSPPGTLVNTPVGEVPIESLDEEDSVLGYNVDKHQFQVQIIQDIYCREYDGEVIEITENERTLVLTPEHPVFTKNRGWVDAGLLNEQDQLVIFDHIGA